MKHVGSLFVALALVIGLTAAAQADCGVSRVRVSNVRVRSNVVAVVNPVVVQSFAVAAPVVEVQQAVVATPVLVSQPLVVQEQIVVREVRRDRVNVNVRVRR